MSVWVELARGFYLVDPGSRQVKSSRETHQVSPTDIYVAGSLLTYVPDENELCMDEAQRVRGRYGFVFGTEAEYQITD